jgi:hypothetical protein
MKETRNARPPESEVREAISKFRGNPQVWVKCRVRILEELLTKPDASDSELADLASTKLKTVEGLLQRWKVEGLNAVIRFGRPPELMEADRKELQRLILTHKLESPEAVQEWVEHRSRLPQKNAFTVGQARAIYDRARRLKRVRPQYNVPAKYLANLKLTKPKVAAALEKVLDGASLREAAGTGCESLLRYYLQRAGKKSDGVTRDGVRQAFFAWCDQQNKTDITFKAVEKFLNREQLRGRSARTIHRYLQEAKDYLGVGRRHWTCGGSRHSGVASI